MYSETGTNLYNTSLGSFVAGQGAGFNGKFDPKCTYDPVSNRFIVAFLNGSSWGPIKLSSAVGTGWSGQNLKTKKTMMIRTMKNRIGLLLLSL
jgi:hypothetical protein